MLPAASPAAIASLPATFAPPKALRARRRRGRRSKTPAFAPVSVASSSNPQTLPRGGKSARGEGAGVTIVGIGTRGTVVVDRLVKQKVLPLAEYWVLNSDTNSLQNSAAPNRWRLPPGNVPATDSAVLDNAASAANAILSGGVSRRPPGTILVLASAAEAAGAGLETVKAIARLKDGEAPQRKWSLSGFVGRSRANAIAHRGPVLISAVVCPFDFEGPRKSALAAEFLDAAQMASDVVCAVPQASLTESSEGTALTVAEATEYADTTLQWSAWTVLEMLRSPAWVGTNAAGGAGKVLGWDQELTAGLLRSAVTGRDQVGAGIDGCGVASVGHGAANVQIAGFPLEQAQAAAVRQAVIAAARDSPFLRGSLFRAAELVACSITVGGELTAGARAAASDALAQLTNGECVQVITAPPADVRAARDVVEVTLMVVTEPSVAYAPRKLGEKRRETTSGAHVGRGSKDSYDTSVSFPEIPGISNVKPGRLASAFNEAKRAQQALGIGYDATGPRTATASGMSPGDETAADDDEGKAKKAQKLTGEMMRKLGLNDPKRMVDEHEEGQKRAANGRVNGDPSPAPAVSFRGEEEEEKVSKAQILDAAARGEAPPPLPVPKKRETVRVKVESALPMPDPEEVAARVEAPEEVAKPAVEPLARNGAKVFADVHLEDEAEEPEQPEPEPPEPAPEPVADVAAAAMNRPKPPKTVEPSVDDDASAVAADAAEKAGSVPDVVVALPREMGKVQVAIRILEMEEDGSGNVIGYKDLSRAPANASDGGGADSDSDEEYRSDEPAPKRGIFGWTGREKQEAPRGSKDAVKNRLASVLDKDRSGWSRDVVRMEFAGSSVYEGEWAAGKQEGEGKQVYSSGDWYEGRWREGLPDDRGKLWYMAGGHFEGMWMGGAPNGPGVLDLEEVGGPRVDGRWVDGKLTEQW